MELGILGDPGAPAISTQGRRKEQDIATTQPLKMVGPIVLVLQFMKLPVQVRNHYLVSFLFIGNI